MDTDQLANPLSLSEGFQEDLQDLQGWTIVGKQDWVHHHLGRDDGGKHHVRADGEVQLSRPEDERHPDREQHDHRG